MMRVYNIICQKIKAPIIEGKWSLSGKMICLTEFLFDLNHIQSPFVAYLLHSLLSTATKIYSVLLKDFRLPQIFCRDLANRLTLRFRQTFRDLHFPPYRSFFQIFPLKSMTAFIDHLVIKWFRIMIIVKGEFLTFL